MPHTHQPIDGNVQPPGTLGACAAAPRVLGHPRGAVELHRLDQGDPLAVRGGLA